MNQGCYQAIKPAVNPIIGTAMTDWDIYCALCGGPFIAFRRYVRSNVCTPPCRCVPGAPPQYDCAADAYDPEVLTGADDPGVAWLTDVRIIGTNSYSDETCKYALTRTKLFSAICANASQSLDFGESQRRI